VNATIKLYKQLIYTFDYLALVQAKRKALAQSNKTTKFSWKVLFMVAIQGWQQLTALIVFV